MPSFVSWTLLCGAEDCQHQWDDLVERPAEGQPWAYPPCPVCGAGLTGRGLQMPALMQRSYPDGRKRPDIRNAVEALRLESQSYDAPPEQRGQINREIDKLRSTKK